jgi:hypothetical protein
MTLINDFLARFSGSKSGNVEAVGRGRPTNQDPVNIMVNIMRMQRTMYSKEIANWKSARTMAQNIYLPQRRELYELYDDVAIDPWIYGLMEGRIKRVKNKGFNIVNSDGTMDEDLTNMLKKSWFRELIKYAIESKFYGYSLIYFSDFKDGRINGIKLVYREHVRPETTQILKHPYDIAGMDYSQPPFNRYTIGIGEPEDLGLFDKAFTSYLFKKHSWQNWEEFEEIFGIPIRIAKTPSSDPKIREEISNWLSSMGTAAYGVFPEGTDLDIKENKSTDVHQIFNEKRKAANEELEFLISGIKRHSRDGGTYGQEKALSEEDDETTEDDKLFVSDLINERVIPMLRGLGMPFKDKQRFEFDETEWLDQGEKVKVFETLHRMGFKVSREQIMREFNVELDEAETQNPQPETPNPQPANPQPETPNPQPSATYSEFIKMNTELSKLYNHV